jgi:uncharacterized protein YndB with AHSA1/START domain/uncharacterized damage-inducible protein DinB
MEAKTIDADVLTLVRRYPATPGQVFDALADRDAVEQWFGPNDEMTVTVTDWDFEPGGKYRIQLIHQFGNTHTVGGTFIAIEPAKKLSYSWQWEDEGYREMGVSEVTYELTPIDGGTELRLTHAGLPNNEAVIGHSEGWNGGLWRMERLFGPSTLAHDSLILALNRRLFNNVLKDVSEDHLKTRVATEANHINWIAGHIAHTRVMIANLLGSEFKIPLENYNNAILDDAKYVSLDEIIDVFNKATHAVHTSISTATKELLNGPAHFELPITDQTIGGMVSFLVQHEAYHIGQLGILRKALGYDAMSYA